MADWPMFDHQLSSVVGADTSASDGTSLPAGATINTKNTWTQLIASTVHSASYMWVSLHSGAPGRSALVDIGIGAAGQETVVYADLLNAATNQVMFNARFPCNIPAGTRVAARVQSTAANANTFCLVHLFGSGFLSSSPLGKVTTYGADTTDSGGTEIDPGGTAHTKGAWTEIVAASSHGIRELTVAIGNQANGTRTAADQLIDIGIGAAGQEAVLLKNLYLAQSTVSLQPGAIGPLPMTIPRNSRIVARAQSSIIDATDRLFDVVLYGAS